MEEMTTTPRVLDGVAIAAEIKAEVGAEVQQLAARGIVPGLAVILVGEVPASQIYVRSKVKTCGELGIYSEILTPDASITTDEMLALVAGLNAREDIDGILIQLPLPKHVDTKRLLEAVSPDKDVDGFHPVNAGRFAERAAWADSVHACWHHRDTEAQQASDYWAECCNRGTVGYRGQAGGDDAAE